MHPQHSKLQDLAATEGRVPATPAAQVRGLEFNGLSPNLLASGGSDGELCIWDVAVPSAPNLYPGLKARAPA